MEYANIFLKVINVKVVITARNMKTGSADIEERLQYPSLEVVNYTDLNLSMDTSEDTLYELVKDADYIIAGVEPYTRNLLKRLPKLKMISKRGIGFDSVDIEACKELGITVTRTTGAVEAAVAEHVLAYLFYFARRIDLQNTTLQKGIWKRIMVSGLRGSSIGLVGFGGIGKEIALRAYPMGMKIYYYCRHPQIKWEKEYHVEYKPLDELLELSDYVSVNVPLTKDTENMIDHDFISKMKQDSILINIARGAIQDDQAILEGIISKKLRGAAIDVFRNEPCLDSILLGYENIILTPHSASYTDECFGNMNYRSVDNLLEYLTGNLDEKYYVVK